MTAAPRPATYVVDKALFEDGAGRHAQVEARLTDRDGVTRTLTLTVALTGKWHVCGDPVI